jgi:hypothetical protein
MWRTGTSVDPLAFPPFNVIHCFTNGSLVGDMKLEIIYMLACSTGS